MTFRRQFLLLMLCGWIVSSAFATPSNTENSLFNYLRSQEFSELTIEINLDTLMAQKKSESKQNVIVRFANGTTFEAKAAAKGRFRRRLCDFPPLKLDFSKDDLKAAGFAPFDDLKLTTHCFEDNSGEDYLMREYLAYQLFENLTPRSFRSKLVKITYINTSKNGPNKIKRYALIVEDDDELAARLNGTLVKQYSTPWSMLNQSQANLVTSFEYMIGNTDWSLETQHNIKLIKLENEEQLIPVPYDFDFSGMVNAHYAVPNSKFNLANVLERHYMGPQPPSAAICAYLKMKKEDLLAQCKNLKLMNNQSRQFVLEYLEAFYKELTTGEAFALK